MIQNKKDLVALHTLVMHENKKTFNFRIFTFERLNWHSLMSIFSFSYATGSREFYVYSTDWKPVLSFLKLNSIINMKNFWSRKRFHKSKFFCHITTGNVPREMTQQVWYAMSEGVNFSAKVKSEKPKLSPLKQAGLEIIIYMTIWENERQFYKNTLTRFSSHRMKISKMILLESPKSYSKQLKRKLMWMLLTMTLMYNKYHNRDL